MVFESETVVAILDVSSEKAVMESNSLLDELGGKDLYHSEIK